LVNIDFRIALHDLADPTPGYPELAQIEFFPMRLRVDTRDQRVHLDDFALVRVISLSPQDRFDRKISWKVSAGATTIRDGACDQCLAGQLALGGGAAFAFFDEALTVFGMADTQVLFSPPLDGIQGIPLRAGVGPSGGVRLRLHPRLVTLVTGHWLWLPAQRVRQTWRADAILRWAYLKNAAASLEARAFPEAMDLQAMAMFYF
jgi:hypothetical protein